jgi:plastocyanin
MKIKIPKNFLYLFGVVIFGLILFRLAARSSPPSQTPSQPPAPSRPPASLRPSPLPSPSPARKTENPPGQQVREIQVTAKQFSFTPNPIRVKLGETVRLRLTSVDVAHGFSLPAFGINEVLPPGQTVTVDFQATKKGTFPFACSVFCGSGHAGMTGSLIVD